MRALRFLLFLFVIVLIFAACGSEDESDISGLESEPDPSSRLSREALNELQSMDITRFFDRAVVKSEQQVDEYTKVTFEPDSGPICLRGTEFSVFYLDRDSDKTMILLDGGGACWTGFCMATEAVGDSVLLAGPSSSSPDNYFADWNLVSVPYCDGSVFSGDNEVIEKTDAGESKRYHHGQQNLAAALDITKTYFGDSTQILIGGFSAGGYGTISGMVAVRLAFPVVDLFVMNDSGPGVQNPANDATVQLRIEEWRFDQTIPASCTGCEGGYGQLSQMYQWMLDNDETVKISMLSYYEDSVIGTFFNEMSGPDYKALLLTETDSIHANHPDRFKRFMLPGQRHVVSRDWSTVTADGVLVSDWVTAMVTGDDSVWKDILADGP
ncbi:MAG: hypothetical protein JXA30_14785 [Deltaproteobacteria bacterium]|nr:hypothetical protein [Deltaproteobacteria bacterium]